ncbi:general transcription factor 3C polypeptide 6-like [Saccostrea echinata]|uniref:general transcription factor 3C polypeptide 6-like n=1 Tax=Saccostrea echinata TaxID=191078 RepID=UPI002A81C34A|nr:general transcription factor 3C polypeptide 6-like [Saccostrea echinata]
MDSSEEWEEEEQCLLVELHGILEPDFLQKAEGKCKVLGIGTETPHLQLDDYTFSGKYVPPMGSYLILEEKKPEDGNNAEDSKNHVGLEFVSCLDRKLDMHRTFISPKIKESSTNAEKSETSNASTSQQDLPDKNSCDGPASVNDCNKPAAMETCSEVT